MVSSCFKESFEILLILWRSTGVRLASNLDKSGEYGIDPLEDPVQLRVDCLRSFIDFVVFLEFGMSNVQLTTKSGIDARHCIENAI